ncbi:acetyl-CoA carboxylase biotin carboxyl carrier protein [Brevibacillus nitrificans]|uniref:acetyl-CoA carboxylase biotin carboxyl carrier protein n=1 Tax=Brevibacillus nitrificans TaxID=651560 RepID=UPI002859133C|nr:acetyl-CoA carboxylase biotin carboxyl carrier protein [Brevibacillus nitrificans]MDR7317587.1 acetyl-CoA carboxylase biotin carboxyl carrier protein [Brevibacillus nitrificans]
MLTIYEVRELVKLLEQTDVESIEIKEEDARLSIKRRSNGVVVQTQPAKKAVLTPLKTAAPTQAEPAKPVIEAVRPAAEVQKAPTLAVDHTENLHKVTSPMVGTFYAAPEVDAAPYVSVGSQVEKSTIVCIVEAMKLFNEIEAEVNGEIVQVLVENGQLVDLGQPLFLVKMAK